MRDALGEALAKLGEEIPELVVVGADTSGSLKLSVFGSRFPQRFFNVGIAEQNMVGVAAGLALAGKKVVCGSYAVFMPGRAVDQIRNTIAYCRLDVKLVGSHGGVSVGPDGGSHQALEDIAIMRSIPNMNVIVPADGVATKKLFTQACRSVGPYYVRLARPSSPAVYTEDTELRVGRAEILRDGSDVAIIAAGLMVDKALRAAQSLRGAGVSAMVVDSHTVKPLDTETILSAARTTGAVVTAEEHNVFGGVGSAVAELLVKTHPVKMEMVGVNDVFGESGETDELMDKYGLTEKHIFEAAMKMVKQK
ncbi:transketolase [Candidatus Marsarchaeota G2 archaeon BE_D]|jgi:Transketolase, C-terminal subunit|uniref:Transketolase n=1 Tax=Candidatus Marsarchaeota G2 archaeon BE_D TaxID=1978158 RepID=A0A2R6CB24_9ARCH|nr:MAG: transketolase [Candidatus Marsarchaeota G2 archaeon BE_D]